MNIKSVILGVGIGLILSATIFIIVYSIDLNSLNSSEVNSVEISDEEIEQRAREMGMIYYSELPESITETELEIDSKSDFETKENFNQNYDELNSENDTINTQIETTTSYQEDNIKNDKMVSIRGGINASRVCKILENAGVVDNSADFEKYLIETGQTTKIKSGDFYFSESMKYSEIADIITEKPH